MKQYLTFSKRNLFIWGGIALVLIIVGYLIFRSKNPAEETITVKLGNFENLVSVSGKVVASDNVDLGFKTGGRVEHINFLVGQTVKKGQAIANLDSADVKGSLDVAQANYNKVLNGATSTDIDVAKASVASAQTALDQTKLQQDTLVKNAKKNLLNSGFVVTTTDNLSNQNPPVITGTYLLGTEGQIIITPYASSGGTSFKTTGLIETTGMESIEVPQPIGNTGLYIKFSNLYDRTVWTLNIPNTESPSYTQNLNAYQAALATETQMVANATALLTQAQSALTQKQASARPEDVAAARGALSAAQGAYDNDFIYAPADGVVTVVNLNVGAIAQANQRVISMIIKTNNQ